MSKSKPEFTGTKPSEMMRAKRPELYSDSMSAGAYKLSRPVLSHHLSTLTERNEHKPFEEFCRALAQREICRNLRPQTGPEGGGDGKVDTETYPVSPTVSQSWFEGIANEAGDSWAFAFSAKKAWSGKVKSDVKGIVETGRPYGRIHFFTNQNPRAKTRLELETELTKQHSIPVTIYDRNWIEEKVIKNGHADLAYDILGVGEFDPNALRKGANDTYRENELSDIEDAFAHPDKSAMTDFDSVHEALRAAQLSRGLEAPRYQTDGRFSRAISVAKKHGSERQLFVAKYEHAWTAIWWFDDLGPANSIYDELEDHALQQGGCFELERLGNILQIFIARERQNSDASEVYKIDQRSNALLKRLEELAADDQRPNHALYAETLLALHKLTAHMRAGETHLFDDIWIQLSGITDRAQGLGEFPAELIEKMIDVLSHVAPDSEEFDKLVLNVAAFAGDRKKEGHQGEILLKRGKQKLESEKALEAIVWLGQAALAFNKNEYRENKVETLYCLAVAYRSAGLNWAARACALSCMVTLSIIADDEGEISWRSIPSTKLFCLICMQLGHLPNSLQAIYLLRLYQAHLSLSDESAKKLEEDFIELDQLLACALMAVDKKELGHLSKLPDFLDETQLYAARMVLLYRLGYEGIIRDDKSVPPEMGDDELIEFMSNIAGQPATKDMSPAPVLNLEEGFSFRSKVLGVEFSFQCDGTAHQIAVCELLVASLEGFAATMLNRGVFPQAAAATIIIRSIGDEVSIQHERHNFTTFVDWPESVAPSDPTKLPKIHDEIMRFLIGKLNLVMRIQDADKLFEELFRDELVYGRSIVFSNTALSHGRLFGKELSRIGDVPISPPKDYPITEDAPEIVASEFPDVDVEENERELKVRRHTDITVHTIINTHLWDDAKWCGTAYMSYGPDTPPVLGLLFTHSDVGEEIFKQLREKVGDVDKEELIRIGIIRGVDKTQPYFYNVHVSQNRALLLDGPKKTSATVMSLSRVHLMQAVTDRHLNLFLEDRNRIGAFFLVPMKMTDTGPEPLMNLRILVRTVYVTDAWQIDSQHEDAAALPHPEKASIPENEKNPPVAELIRTRNALREAF